MTDMPTTYETQQTTTTASPNGIGPHIEYLKTIPGILKIVEIVLSLIVVICIAVQFFPGDGWVWFVSMSAFITVLIWFILYFIGVYGRLPAWRGILEFIYYCIFTVFYLIAAIIAAARAGQGWGSGAGAAAFFAFAATAVFAVDTFFQFRAWRAGQTEMATSTSTTTTTTTHTHVEQKATY